MGDHATLVKRAARWLSSTRRCGLVVIEPQSWSCNEWPDAIGWMPSGHSILIECKVSRSDFHADKRKCSRRAERESMGRERWYLAPPGLLRENDLPPGYGLLELSGARLVRKVEAAVAERPGRQAAELPLLVWAARKNGWQLAKPNGVRAVCLLPAEKAEVLDA